MKGTIVTHDHRGSTALITGASSGLGEEFARQLAAKGANLVLVARRGERLEELASELRVNHPVTVTTFAQDLGAPGAARAVSARLAELDIPVHTLVNNAGFATRNRFENEDPERIRDEIALNVAALVDLTREFYPQMLHHSRGALITVASTGAYQPVPMMAVYGATKAFVLSFTEALWVEAKDSGLKVLALSPGATRTEFFDHAGDDAQVGSMQTPATVVRLALATLDRRDPPPSVISGTRNRLTAGISRVLSRRATARVAGAVIARGRRELATGRPRR